MKKLFLRVLLIATLVPFSAQAAQSESGGGTLTGFSAAHGFAGANNHVAVHSGWPTNDMGGLSLYLRHPDKR